MRHNGEIFDNMIVALTPQQFKGTMNNMVDVTETAEAIVDIWPYVEVLVKKDIVHKYVFENQLIESVSRNDTCTYEHVLLPTAEPDTFIVIVIDLIRQAIFGHFKLDLKKEYGLT
jgi:hypothetical protein